MPWYRVATEGATTDGRAINRAWIEQMAANYDRKRYGARVWIEHLRGLLPDSLFPAVGDVMALRAESVEDGKLALFADLDPTDMLRSIVAKRQKVYTSIEIDPNFADSGAAYLVGLAVTDSPASLGTDMLAFSATSGALSNRKQRPDNLFTAAEQVDLSALAQAEPTPDPSPAPDDAPLPPADLSLLARVRALFGSHDAAPGQAAAAALRGELAQALEFLTGQLAGTQDRLAAAEQALALHATTAATHTANLAAQDARLAALDAAYARIDATPATPPLPQPSGATAIY